MLGIGIGKKYQLRKWLEKKKRIKTKFQNKIKNQITKDKIKSQL